MTYNLNEKVRDRMPAKIDPAEFVSDYVQTTEEVGEPPHPSKHLAEDIVEGAREQGLELTLDQVRYYLGDHYDSYDPWARSDELRDQDGDR